MKLACGFGVVCVGFFGLFIFQSSSSWGGCSQVRCFSNTIFLHPKDRASVFICIGLNISR